MASPLQNSYCEIILRTDQITIQYGSDKNTVQIRSQYRTVFWCSILYDQYRMAGPLARKIQYTYLYILWLWFSTLVWFYSLFHLHTSMGHITDGITRLMVPLDSSIFGKFLVLSHDCLHLGCTFQCIEPQCQFITIWQCHIRFPYAGVLQGNDTGLFTTWWPSYSNIIPCV